MTIENQIQALKRQLYAASNDEVKELHRQLKRLRNTPLALAKSEAIVKAKAKAAKIIQDASTEARHRAKAKAAKIIQDASTEADRITRDARAKAKPEAERLTGNAREQLLSKKQWVQVRWTYLGGKLHGTRFTDSYHSLQGILKDMCRRLEFLCWHEGRKAQKGSIQLRVKARQEFQAPTNCWQEIRTEHMIMEYRLEPEYVRDKIALSTG